MKYIFSVLLVSTSLLATAQYRYDNVAFNTIHWDELCAALKQSPDHLLLDVRSKGEYDDTSAFRSLNIGRLKGAMNIDIREIEKRLDELEAYKQKPVFVYCSHSQRSRRVSKLLHDKGFSHVVNINGGVSNLRMFGFRENCDLLTSSLPYQIVSPKALSKLSDFIVLDIRSDSAYRGIAVMERQNALGRFENAVHIPLVMLEQNLSRLPKDKAILIVDEFGNEAPLAAGMLHKTGFTNLAVLFNGLEAYITEVPEADREGWINTVPYHTINAVTLDQLAKKQEITFLDIRSADEFNNTAKEGYLNIGRVKNAINIPAADWDRQAASLPGDKEKPVVVYAFNSTPQTFEVVKKLSALGYKNVFLLMGGLFNLRWRAANLKGHESLKAWVVNVPPDNQ